MAARTAAERFALMESILWDPDGPAALSSGERMVALERGALCQFYVMSTSAGDSKLRPTVLKLVVW